ncbi:zinc finger protein VAR3, chloroplastic [Quillaja saponaria]|uniref:Zinc finger protein VAR3, chloroplastic n=1 Tax=Quillaja saponaria TaxID=32244 RepID=A0AAD7M5B5_QUISA|nr:zinc finger protein VAR3, chloroplastic [Quillaja saponaria]
MSASKLLRFGTALCLTPGTLSPLSSLLFSPKLLSSPSLQFHHYSFSAVADTIIANNPETTSPLDQHQHHPWLEWVTFVDRLKTKYYLIESPTTDGAGVKVAADSVYMNMNLVKDAYISFSRDGYNAFKSLSLEDIQAVVQGGCSNVFGKVVNSAKRLRAYMRLDEGDVCNTCNLLGSWDYEILKESDADACTVDIVRILLFYALDPVLISGGQKPPGRLLVESSTRKLLSQLVDLSESSPDPTLPKPAPKSSPKQDPSLNPMTDKLSQDVEMKRGDWICPKCNFVNFARNIRCLKCKAEGPKRVSADNVEMKKGDWNCPECNFMNFSSNRKCLRCREPRPKRQLNPGEWECPSCDYVNFRKNVICMRCNCDRPT